MENLEDVRKSPERPYYDEVELGEVYGKYEAINVPVDKIVTLPQVRGSRLNPNQAELTRSISSGGLINPVDIVLFTPEQLTSHLEFINGIWKTHASLNDYNEPNNGLYPVLIAGHSRLGSIRNIQNEEGSPKSVSCKIHEISSSAEFLSLQLAENTYGGINPERRAIAIVEMYHYGYDEKATPDDNRHWSSYADFARKNPGNLSQEILSDGMAFAELSPGVRDFIFAGKLYYGAGVELGKNSKTIRAYIDHQMGDASDDKKDQAYSYELSIIISHLTDSRQNAKGGLKKATEYIKNKVAYMKSVINPPDSATHQQTMLIEFLNSPNAQYHQYLESLKKEHKEIIEKLKRQPADSLINYLQLDGALTGEDHSEDIRQIETVYQENIGRIALKGLVNQPK
jgi:hypothetical protein